MPAAAGARALAVAVLPDPTATPAPAAGTPTLDLHCVGTGTCTGVYPLVVSLQRPAGAGPPRRSPTRLHHLPHLRRAASTTPLGFTWVAPLAAPVAITDGRPPPPWWPRRPVAPPLPSRAWPPHLAARRPCRSRWRPRHRRCRPSTPVAGGGARRSPGWPPCRARTRRPARSCPSPTSPSTSAHSPGPGEGEEVSAQIRPGAAVLHSLGVTTLRPPGDLGGHRDSGHGACAPA